MEERKERVMFGLVQLTEAIMNTNCQKTFSVFKTFENAEDFAMASSNKILKLE